MSGNDALRLEVADFTDRDHWHWRLTDAAGKFLADYEAALDPTDAEYAGFLDLEAYLDQYAAPDKWPEDEVRLIEEVGAWIGQRMLGPVATRIVDYGTPVTVRVVVPPEASGLLYRPLELAHAYDQPLALHDVSLVFEVAGEAPPVRPRPVGDRLRMLAVFSLPTDVSALALRRERHALKRLIQRIAQMYGLAIELRVLQYGVTRDALREILEEGESWDVMHFSGHGLRAGLMLEQPDGRQDLVTTDDLEKLLRPARGRLKLVTLSSCLSAAATIEETLRWLGIQPPPSAPPPSAEEPEEGAIPAVARALVRDLDCAVLAMRYPVGDDFAIALSAELYERLLGKRQRLARALQLALPSALGERPQPGTPPLSVATPALFGRRAVGLTLKPPPSAATNFAPPPTGLAYFPPEPERFVGRVGPMSRASAALAPQSSQTGILFHGMAGAGKTACALELAYRYESGRFQGLVWHKAPDESSDIEGALLNLALDIEKQLPGLQMAHLVDHAEEFVAWLPRLTELLERYSILIVLDNLESLLTTAGRWRDERWGHLVKALLAHHGLSRTVLTSRRRPADLGDRVLVEPIHALSLSEATLLARELPNLGRLLRGESPVGLAEGRKLAARTLAVVQGHPKLIELADGQASDPEALAAHLERAAEAWTGGERRLQAFFSEGESPFEAGEFLTALTNWTQGLSAALPPVSRTFFHFLCCLEEADRQSGIVKTVWPHLWQRLEQPGEAPDLVATLEPLSAAGLVEARPLEEGGEETGFLYNLHPGVAEAGRAEAGDDFQAAVDAKLAAFWASVFGHGLKEEMHGGGRLLVQAGQGATPYLLRQHRSLEAYLLLDQVIQREQSPRMVATILPLLRHTAAATEGTDLELLTAGMLATALLKAGRWLEAEAMMRDIVRLAAERGEFLTASTATGYLINILRDTGRPEAALAVVEEMKDYTRRAGLGPWTQLFDEGQRLQLLNALGRYEEVLSTVEELREQMWALSDNWHETVSPWTAKETTLNAGNQAALLLERWETALDLNAETVASQEARGASALVIARNRFNDYFALLGLGRYGEARTLLRVCRGVFEKERDTEYLGKVFGALSDLEGRLGHGGQAMAFVQASLRYAYLAGNTGDCAIAHLNLANSLMLGGGSPEAALAHCLAAGMIDFQCGSGRWRSIRPALAQHLANFVPDPTPLPASFDELCRIVETVEGVRFRELFERLPRRAASGDEALREVLRLTQEIDSQT